MITIEQRLFEGKEDADDLPKGKYGDRNVDLDVAKGKAQDKKAMAKPSYSQEVEEMFQKICQSIELYKAENIPIITEFLEF